MGNKRYNQQILIHPSLWCNLYPRKPNKAIQAEANSWSGIFGCKETFHNFHWVIWRLLLGLIM